MKNYSKQREEVLEVLKNSYQHPTAEEVYQTLKLNKRTSSRSTVYRNLGLLEEENIIKRILIPDGPDRYDYFKKPHNHVICKNCGKIADFEYDFRAIQIIDAIKEDTEMESSMDNITIEATCNDCVVENKRS
ncbi:MAG: transcriptional repressor [Oscillospiraceae bacterium]|nr:transcriptional repressor [Oscillospiraceae bacterium]